MLYWLDEDNARRGGRLHGREVWVTADGTVNVLVPLTGLSALSIPPLAITDGSADPTWVDVRCTGPFVYGRTRTLRLPFDAATAEVVHRRLRLHRRVRAVWFPISMTLMGAAPAMFYVPGQYRLGGVLYFVLCVAGTSVLSWSTHLGRKFAVAQDPELVGRLGVYLPAVSAPVAQAWIAENPAVLAVPRRPPWRRHPSLTYRWAAGACAIAGITLWWAALRDGTSSLSALLAFLVLLGAAVVLAFKALPIGSVHWDDAT